jgi:hypothetical protein
LRNGSQRDALLALLVRLIFPALSPCFRCCLAQFTFRGGNFQLRRLILCGGIWRFLVELACCLRLAEIESISFGFYVNPAQSCVVEMRFKESRVSRFVIAVSRWGEWQYVLEGADVV